MSESDEVKVKVEELRLLLQSQGLKVLDLLDQLLVALGRSYEAKDREAARIFKVLTQKEAIIMELRAVLDGKR